jgi:leader peptidase (prepilin peptidase) / N-methyltransferase
MGAVWLLVPLGAAMGSFAALLAERLPRGEAVALARSRCRQCGTALGARDLVPVLSYLWLRGHCRHCGAAIPARLWQAESAGLGLGLAAALLAPDPGAALAAALWLWCLLALALTDLRVFRLPDPLTATLLGLGIAVSWPDWAGAGLGAALGAGAFLVLRLGYRATTGREGMGLGDVKLMAGIGAGLGPLALPWVALIAAGSALLLAALRAWRRKRRLRRLGRIPFGAYLAGAAVAVWIVQRL